MKIETISNINKTSFKGMWNNKFVLKGLETAANHSTSFIAATSCIMALGVRPLAISLTPDTKRENKEYAITNSISSALVKFALVEAVAVPVENALKKIEKIPEKFLKQKTIDTFTKKNNNLSQSKDFKFISQFIKLSSGMLTAIPKSVISVALIPILMDKFFFEKKKRTKKEFQTELYKAYNPVFSPAFSGGITDKTAKGIGKILDINAVQNFAKKFSTKDTDIARNMAVATDLLLTASFAHQVSKNKKIKKDRKKPLIMNNIYSTAASIICGCTIDSFIKNGTKNFIEKFSEMHKNNPKLPKYIEGINIIRPTLIFAGIYYGILPMITTYFADKTRTDKKHFL